MIEIKHRETGAVLYRSERSSLAGADLTGAGLAGADLAGQYLEQAELTGADLTDADLRRADLVAADLTGADLRGADLRGALLQGWNWPLLVLVLSGGAVLSLVASVHVWMTRGLRPSVVLGGICFTGCLLLARFLVRQRRRLSDAILDGADVAGARYNRQTRWPAGFDPGRHGARLLEE
jgi:uncharacterized protein YjbI with pentapeptide repeats